MVYFTCTKMWGTTQPSVYHSVWKLKKRWSGDSKKKHGITKLCDRATFSVFFLNGNDYSGHCLYKSPTWTHTCSSNMIKTTQRIKKNPILSPITKIIQNKYYSNNLTPYIHWLALIHSITWTYHTVLIYLIFTIKKWKTAYAKKSDFGSKELCRLNMKLKYL